MPAKVLRAAAEIGADDGDGRKLPGQTAEQVAVRANTTRKTLGKLEHGDPPVGFHFALRVARTTDGSSAVVRSFTAREATSPRRHSNMTSTTSRIREPVSSTRLSACTPELSRCRACLARSPTAPGSVGPQRDDEA